MPCPLPTLSSNPGLACHLKPLWVLGGTILCCTILCCTILYCTILCCTILCCTILCCTILCCTLLCCTILCCTQLCCIILCCTLFCCTILCCTILCCTMLCCTLLYCIILCCTQLCCTILCTILYTILHKTHKVLNSHSTELTLYCKQCILCTMPVCGYTVLLELLHRLLFFLRFKGSCTIFWLSEILVSKLKKGMDKKNM